MCTHMSWLKGLYTENTKLVAYHTNISCFKFSQKLGVPVSVVEMLTILRQPNSIQQKYICKDQGGNIFEKAKEWGKTKNKKTFSPLNTLEKDFCAA